MNIINDKFNNEYDYYQFTKERESLYKIYKETDRDSLQQIIRKGFTDRIKKINDKVSRNEITSKSYRLYLIVLANAVALDMAGGTKDTALKIQSFFNYKLGIRDNIKNYIENGPSCEEMANRILKTLNKLLNEKFLSNEEKQEKIRNRTFGDIRKELNIDLLKINTNDHANNPNTLNDPIDFADPKSETAENSNSDMRLDLIPEAQREEEIIEDQVTNTKIPTKKWLLPIRFVAAIFGGIASFVGTVIGLPFRAIKNLFSKGG